MILTPEWKVNYYLSTCSADDNWRGRVVSVCYGNEWGIIRIQNHLQWTQVRGLNYGNNK